MVLLKHADRVIDISTVEDTLSHLSPSSPLSDKIRRQLVTALKPVIEKGRLDIYSRLQQSHNGEIALRELAWLMDQAIKTIFEFALRGMEGNTAKDIALVATGGYGRAVLAPYSDIDLLLLHTGATANIAQQLANDLTYTLWDMGVKVGHTLGTAKDMMMQAEADITTRTSLLDMRFLSGDEHLQKNFEESYNRRLVIADDTAFIAAKLAERDDRHQKCGDSRYVLEPNIKEGKGALRDMQTLHWISKIHYQAPNANGLLEHGVFTKDEYAEFLLARKFFWTVRAFLHIYSERPEERLTFDMQPRISETLGYQDRKGMLGVERFMKRYFSTCRDVGDLTRIVCASLESEQRYHGLFQLPSLLRKHVEGFPVEGKRLSLTEEMIANNPLCMMQLFEVSVHHKIDVHPQALKLIKRNLHRINPEMRKSKEANQLFMSILTAPQQPGQMLRRLSEAGILGKFILDYGRIVAQIQYNLYHVHTVDEHTLFAISTVNDLENGILDDDFPLITTIFGQVQKSRKLLYLALFLHDIAKGRPEDHSVVGERIARKIGKRMGLSSDETSTVAWLVRHHLLFSNTAFRRDLDDPETLRQFTQEVGSIERLRLLMLLTIADIMAVSPTTWNGWKGALLQTLYQKAEHMLMGHSDAASLAERIGDMQCQLFMHLNSWQEAEKKRYTDKAPNKYWLSLESDELMRASAALYEVWHSDAPIAIHTHDLDEYDVTELIVCCPDQAGLFSALTGAITLGGASVTAARIFTFSDGTAVDVFWIQDVSQNAFSDSNRLARLRTLIEESITGQRQLEREIANKRPNYPQRTEVFKVKPRVRINNDLSQKATVIEATGRDRPGFLYDVTSAISELQLSIVSAQIATYGERAVDAFYVQDVFGTKVVHKDKLAKIHDRLIAAIESPID